MRSRQIVVARLENEVTVKRYKQEGSIVWLLPENADFEPIRVDLKQEPLLIEGVVVGVLRRSAPVDTRSGGAARWIGQPRDSARRFGAVPPRLLGAALFAVADVVVLEVADQLRGALLLEPLLEPAPGRRRRP